MKVLVTGKNGQLGWELSQTQATALSSEISAAEVLFVGSEELDITVASSVDQLVNEFQPDVVINAAAYTAVDKAESDKEAAYAVNATGVENLAVACQSVGACLIHVSTDFVFGSDQNTPYQPDDKTNPLGVYGASKRAGEEKAISVLGDQVSIVRTAWVYSTHGANFVKSMIRLMSEKDQLGIVSDQIGTPTSAKNLANALWQLVALRVSGAKAQQVYHWTDLGVASWYDFAVAIQEIALEVGLLSKAIPVKPIFSHEYPTPAKRPSFSVMDTSSLREFTGLSGQHWRTALTSMLKELAQ